jgi:beta-lactamase class A
LVLVIAAEVALGVVGATRAEPVAGLAWAALRTATYPTSLSLRTVTLRDGVFEAEAAPGSATKVIVRLVDIAAFGDLDGDERPDAAVVLVTSPGGTGVFIDLVAVRNVNGAAQPVARALLGDRILVREVRIEDRQIVVRIRTRAATDPLARLTRETSRRYALDGGQLALRDEMTADVPLTSPDEFVYRPERLVLDPGSARTVQGSLPPGQIASYVVRGATGQVLELSARSLFNNAVLSVSGLTDGLTLVSRQEYAVDRALLLPSTQDYAVRVITLAGQPLPFTLEAKLLAAQRTPEPTARPAQPLPSATPRPAASAPGGLADRPLAQLSDDATRSARARPPIVGVAVVVPASTAIYTQNADEQVPTASVVKVLIMLTVLDRARQERRPLTDTELALLWPMITESDNDSTSQLWEDIGRGQAVGSYLRSIGVTGFTPDPGTSWGVSFASARAMAIALGKLVSGEILDEPSRALAFRLLESVIAPQRWGVTAGTDPADQVGVKDGWYPGEEGWRVNSVGVVRPRGRSAYAIAVMTGARASWDEGIATIEEVSQALNAARARP